MTAETQPGSDHFVEWTDRPPPAATRGISSDHLFNIEGMVVAIVRLAPGAVVPVHRHEHADEIFDVMSGMGEVFIDGEWRTFRTGATVFVEANTEHALRNPGAEPFVLRETQRERVYARAAIKAAVAKRLGRIKS